MKSMFVWFAAATLGAAVSWTPATAAELKAKPGQKFALLMSHMDNEFTIQMSGAVKDKAKALDANLTIFDARNDIAKQISQVETVVTQGYTGLMIEPVAVDGLGPALEAAKKAGLAVINVNQRVSDPKVTDTYVGANPIEGGEIENVLKKYPDIKVVYKQTANWRTDQALKLAENWLQTGADLAAIVSNNDDMALGAVKAVKDAHLTGKIKIAGIDAAPNALAAVKDGGMAATVSQNTVDQGQMAMEAAVKLANGEKIAPTIIVPHVLITKENVDKYMK
jgi:ribose transport system substrate-binding protein/inositol transport system substrate-binding protein